MLVTRGWLGLWKLGRKPLEHMMLVMHGLVFGNFPAMLKMRGCSGYWKLSKKTLEQMMLMTRDLPSLGKFSRITLRQLMLMMRDWLGLWKVCRNHTGSNDAHDAWLAWSVKALRTNIWE